MTVDLNSFLPQIKKAWRENDGSIIQALKWWDKEGKITRMDYDRLEALSIAAEGLNDYIPYMMARKEYMAYLIFIGGKCGADVKALKEELDAIFEPGVSDE